jgi:hypothetical protein
MSAIDCKTSAPSLGEFHKIHSPSYGTEMWRLNTGKTPAFQLPGEKVLKAIESTPAGAKCISVGQKQRQHRNGHRNGSRQDTFNGFTTAEVIRLGKEPIGRLTRKARLALELYWNARLAAMGDDVDRGIRSWLTYAPDIAVLDFFSEDKTYISPTGERTDET